MHNKALIVGITSDIGKGLSSLLEKNGWEVVGTSSTVQNEKTLKVNLKNSWEIENFFANVDFYKGWKLVIFLAATMKPIGPFFSLNFDTWEDTLAINATAQLQKIGRAHV